MSSSVVRNTFRSWRVLVALFAAACFVCTSGCSTSPAAPDAGGLHAGAIALDASSDAAPAIARRGVVASPLSWLSTTIELGPDATSAPVSFMLPRAAQVLAVRTFAESAATSSPLCFQLENVVVNGDTTWVGSAKVADYGDYCTGCEQRVSVGTGYGFYVLPSAADASLLLTGLQLRVALRDCVTLTPLQRLAPHPDRLALEHVAWDPPAADSVVDLPLAVVIASAYALAADASLLREALETLRSTWAVAKIEIELAEPVSIAPPNSPVIYSATDHASLLRLTQSARAALAKTVSDRAWPVVVIAPCLRREDVVSGGHSEPLSTTPHIPGGSGVYDEPDMIFVAGERCAGLEPGPNFIDSATLGALMAHELGHFLGLYHVEELDGRADNLADTDVDQPNLMRAIPTASTLALTRSQIEIARRHIAFGSAPTQSP